MATRTPTAPAPRTPLTKERVLRAAIDLADAGGIESLSMRKLGQALGVEAMSLYNHARNKEDILDGIVDVVVGEIEQAPEGVTWKSQLRQQVLMARDVLLRHPWAPGVIESRSNPSPAVLAYMNAVLGIMRNGGFSVSLTHHAIHTLGSRIFGFTQELFDDAGKAGPAQEAAATMARDMATRFPYITEVAGAASHEGGLGLCDDDIEFSFALDLMLDGLDALRGRDH